MPVDLVPALTGGDNLPPARGGVKFSAITMAVRSSTNRQI